MMRSILHPSVDPADLCPRCGCGRWWHDQTGCHITGPPDPTGRYPGCACTLPHGAAP